VQPALVGAANDPEGHGGVGVDIFGSYENLPGAPFTTATGTSTITVTIGPGVRNKAPRILCECHGGCVTFGGSSFWRRRQGPRPVHHH
jgi:hypothetical protein